VQRNLASQSRWIMDGDLGPYDALPVRLSMADTVLLLDFPLWLCLWRALRRGKERWDFWWWLITWGWLERPKLRDMFAEHPNAPVKTYAEMAESSLVVESRRKALRDDIGQSPDDPIFLKQLRVRETLRTAIMKVMAEQRLDAFLYPSFDHEPPLLPKGAAGSNRLMAAFTGFPALAIPGGFTSGGLPIGLELMGRPFDEATIYKAAYAYEQGAKPRGLPPPVPPLPK